MSTTANSSARRPTGATTATEITSAPRTMWNTSGHERVRFHVSASSGSRMAIVCCCPLRLISWPGTASSGSGQPTWQRSKDGAFRPTPRSSPPTVCVCICARKPPWASSSSMSPALPWRSLSTRTRVFSGPGICPPSIMTSARNIRLCQLPPKDGCPRTSMSPNRWMASGGA